MSTDPNNVSVGSSKELKNFCLFVLCVAALIFLSILVKFDYTPLLIRYSSLNETHDSDYYKLINITFNFTLLSSICNASENLLFVVVVHSAPENFEKRKTIRETWGENEKVLFMLGTTTDELQKSLYEENEKYNDLVQGNFIDSYKNLTYKHVMNFKYIVYHCPNVRYLLKVDDDTFVNIANLLSFLELYNYEYQNSTNILCSRMHGNPVLRSGKWKVPTEEYPDKYYPYHCSGFAIIYPRKTISLLYEEAQRTKFFWVDDVFASGILAKGTNLTHTGIEKLILSRKEVEGVIEQGFSNLTRPFLFGTINMSPNRIKKLWDYVKKHVPKTSILEYID